MAVAVRAMPVRGCVVSVSGMVAVVVSVVAAVGNAVAMVSCVMVPGGARRMLGSVVMATAIGCSTAFVLDAAPVVAAGMRGAAMVAVVVAVPGMP